MSDEKKLKILIIDDDESIRTMYAEVFKKEGFEVEEAVDGLEGLDKATKNIPDVIFTGIIMPRMDGFGLKEALAKNVTTSNVPVVMFSHMGRKEDEEKAKQMGVREFFVMGMITPNQIVEKVKSTLGDAGEYKIKFSSSELDGPKLAKDLHFDEKFQCKKCGGNLDLALKIFDLNKHEFSARFVCSKCNGNGNN
ncbi:MAG TPA: response regulator [Candidatus Moranbacteria bacterium]|nr:response regulator [Candidatus Moranbacteria bacterium]